MLFTLWGPTVAAHEWMAPAKEGNRINPIELGQSSIDRGRDVTLKIAQCATEKEATV